ncbi:MAG TPA: hypothetical protein VK195_20965 [Burkholderiaceae bacterium]|nr:hypothetical protein [Burkholderiaceae bacterium]
MCPAGSLRALLPERQCADRRRQRSPAHVAQVSKVRREVTDHAASGERHTVTPDWQQAPATRALKRRGPPARARG